MSTREEFEKWAHANGRDVSMWPHHPDKYVWRHTENAWEAWQAAIRTEREAHLHTIGKPESVNADLLEALKSARNGLEWYQDAHPESASECDNEAMQEIDAAIARAESAVETPASAEASIGDALNDPRLQEAFGAAIEGAMGFGYQGINPPPTGHWLNRFWDIGAAERRKVDGFPQPAGFRDISEWLTESECEPIKSAAMQRVRDRIADKVSPCAGHAAQLPDPLGLLFCTHPDCGRYEGPRSHECRAMADNACARPSICQGHAAQQEAAESAIETSPKQPSEAGDSILGEQK